VAVAVEQVQQEAVTVTVETVFQALFLAQQLPVVAVVAVECTQPVIPLTLEVLAVADLVMEPVELAETVLTITVEALVGELTLTPPVELAEAERL